jgi:UDP:flavonoid glycosyltransferase YjiC (YdhE family)
VRIFLVTRGSQGDVYPYLSLARALKENGHEVSISVPFIYEQLVKALNVPYILQSDDIEKRAGKIKLNQLISWLGEMIKSQFDELLPFVEKHDIFITSNTEFAAPSIAEYAGKIFIRTAYAPYIPGKKIMPPILPLVKKTGFLTPALMWNLLNRATNHIALKPVNKWRKEHGLNILKDHNDYAYSTAKNLILYSPVLGEIDNDWKYSWYITGCCSNTNIPYNPDLLEKFTAFANKDSRPVLFFTTGSIKGKAQENFTYRLHRICKKRNYKLLIGSGWANLGGDLEAENVFVLNSFIPHHIVFAYCTALLHHGGSGTTHSAAYAGKPQMVAPLLADQFYWGERTRVLGLGPGVISLKRIGGRSLEDKIIDLMTNKKYMENAIFTAKKLREENGMENTLKFIKTLESTTSF